MPLLISKDLQAKMSKNDKNTEVDKKMIFHFDSMPPSDNSLYLNMPGRGRVLAPKTRTYKQEIEEAVLEQIKHQDRTTDPKSIKYTDQILDLTDKELIVALIFCSSWYTKSDTIRKKDCQNYSKAILDSIWNAFKTINPLLDDSQIWSFSINKIEVQENGGNEYTEVIIKSIEDNIEDEIGE